MGFDLFVNPFAILRLAGNATIGAISSRARELGNGEASAASRILISPRTRLPAELAFLPGATQEQVDECLRTLREGGEPDLWSLTPIARANVLAHLASLGKATPSQLRDLVGMQEPAQATAMEAVNQGRSDASLPHALPEMADGAMQALASQHAGALVDGLIAHEKGAEFLSELLRESGNAVTPRGMFLRQCTAGWERAKFTDLSRIIESAEPLETALRDQPEVKLARRLATVIQELAVATRPQRQAARLLGLPHEPSLDARSRWQSLALDLNNRLDAIPEAVTVLEALESTFDDQDELQGRIVKNLRVCRERVIAGEGTPGVRRLTTAIADATAKYWDFNQCGLVEGRKTPTCPASVVELYDSFLSAAKTATSDLPWSMLRGLTLLLHNEHNATFAAWSLTVLAIAQANLNRAGAPMLSLLTGDKRNLRTQLLQRDFDVAIRSKRKGDMRMIVAELASLTDAPAEKAEYAKILRKLWSDAVFNYIKWGFWAAVAALMLIVFVQAQQTPTRRVTAPITSRPAPATYAAAVPAPAVMKPVDHTTTRPPPGNLPLSISGLRWCRYQKARANGAEAYLDALRPDPTIKVDRFNAIFDAFNAYVEPMNTSCGNFTYLKSDALIVDAEVNEQRFALAAAGKRAMENVYLAFSPPTSAKIPAYMPPSAHVPPVAAGNVTLPNTSRTPYVASVPTTQQPNLPPGTPVSASYADGQNDRQAWEAWMGSTNGSIRDGAEWWAGVRSTQPTPSCSAVPRGNDPAAAAAGCNQAKIRLANSDRRRRAEPDYRAGWNSQ